MYRAGRCIEQGDVSSREPIVLTENELYDNIFVFNIAEHDIIAHTLAFAVVLLSTKPLVQDWLHEERISVLGSNPAENYGYIGATTLYRFKISLREIEKLVSKFFSHTDRGSLNVKPMTCDRNALIEKYSSYSRMLRCREH